MKANATVSVRRNAVQNQESPDNRQGLYEKEYGLSAPSSLRRPARAADRAGFDRSERFQSPPELFRTESPELADNMTRVGLIHAVTLRSRSDGQEGLLARMRREAFSRGPTGGMGDHTG